MGVDVVRSLLADQLPGLVAPLRRVAPGPDGVLYRLGRDLAVRLPRHQQGARSTCRQQRWLPVLAPRLPCPVPQPVFCGSPARGYPWPWTISSWFVGRPLTALGLRERSSCAPALGYFLARLHAPTPPDAPTSKLRGVPLAERGDLLAGQLAVLAADQARAVRRLWPRLCATPSWYGPPLWLHGDPWPGNVVVRENRVVAVVGFGDLTTGDPATDLALGWLAFDRVGRRLLADAYAGAGYLHPDTWTRARGWALCLAVALIAGADDPARAAVGWRGLHQVLTDAG